MKVGLTLLTSVILLAFLTTGCGETITGVIKDTKRIGSGVKRVFIRDAD